jgi:hypothetical protein
MMLILLLAAAGSAAAQSAPQLVEQGNELYAQGRYNKAVEKYEQALVAGPDATQPKFNKADSYYRLEDFDSACGLLKEVAAESKDMKLVASAKYNLGNCLFRQAQKQGDSDLRKALDGYQQSIASWRQVLDMEPENKNAAHNIEVARLIIKDILDRLKNQQQEPNQPGNQQQQQQQQQQSGGQDQKAQEQQQTSAKEPNQPAEPNEQQQQKQQQQQRAKKDEQKADEILDNEQQQRKERQMMQRAGYEKVEKDW